jgi:WD40 repeat protein
MKRIPFYLLSILFLLCFTSEIVHGQVPELLLPLGHSNKVIDAAYSSNGLNIATASLDNTIKVWNAKNGRLLLTLIYSNSVRSLIFSPDGKNVLASSDDTAKIWNSQNGKMLYRFKGHNAVYSPDGKTLATLYDSICKPIEGEDVSRYKRINDDGFEITEYSYDTLPFSYYVISVRIWRTDNGKLLHSFNGETGFATYSPDCKYLLTTNLKNSVEVWDLQNFRLLHTLEGHRAKVLFSAFSPDGKTIISTSEDGTAILWDSQSGTLLHTLEGNEWDMAGAEFSSDCENILTFGSLRDDPFKVWDLESGKLLYSIKPQEINLSASYSPDGKRILISSSDTSIKVLDAKNGRLLYSIEENGTEILSAKFSPDGKNLLTAEGDFTAKIWDAQTGKRRMILTGHSIPVSNATFFADGSKMWTWFSRKPYLGTWWTKNYSVKKGDVSKIWDLKNGKILQSFEGSEWGSAIYYDENKTIHTTSISDAGNTIIKIWNIQNGILVDTIQVQTGGSSEYLFSPDSTTVIVINDEAHIAKILDAKTGVVLHELKGSAYTARYSPDSKYVATSSWFGIVNLWDAGSGKFINSFQGQSDLEFKNHYEEYIDSLALVKETIEKKDSVTEDFDRERALWKAKTTYEMALGNYHETGSANQVRSFDFSQDGRLLFIANSSETTIWDIQESSVVKKFIGTNPVLSPEGKRIMTFDFANGATQRIYDLESGNLLKELNEPEISHASFSPDGKYVILLGFGGTAWDSLKIWDTQNGIIKRSLHYTGFFCDIDWTNEKIIVENNSQLIFFDIRTGRELYKFIAIDSADYMILTPDKYYMCSKNAASKLAWRIGEQMYSFDQFDIQYNRPDIILERLGNPDTTLIKMYRNAYFKRLKKTEFNEEMFSSEWHAPEISILNSDSLISTTEQPVINLNVRGIDTKYNLNRILVWDNNVPVYGANGLSLLKENADSINMILSITLSEGNNSIKVSCINEKGVESLKESVDIIYNPVKPVKPDLYIIAMSVSDYQDKRFDLRYAAKDGKDIAKMFKSIPNSKKTFEHIIIDTLLNRSATRENFFRLKDKLLASNVDDQVIVFVSGHGLLNSQFDFYFATYDIDFGKPEMRGIFFEDLEGILDSIPSRKKLLLMDACHSGEVDKDEMTELTASNTVKTSSDIAFRGNVRAYIARAADPAAMSGVNLNNTLELMQELFSGLDKGTGTTVISAAAGKGYALESPLWNNGVFTFSIINGLKNGAADKNRDGTITISELKDYSIKEVQLLTDGQQKPTARRESINYDWKIW